MPITLDFDEEGNVVGQPKEQQEEAIEESSEVEPEKSDFSDVLGAVFRENAVYLGWKSLQMGKGKAFAAVSPTPDEYPIIDLGIEMPSQEDPDFNLDRTLEERQIPQEDRAYFEHVRSPKQFETIYDYYA